MQRVLGWICVISFALGLVLTACNRVTPPPVTYTVDVLHPAGTVSQKRVVDYWTMVWEIKPQEDGSTILVRKNDRIIVPAGYPLQIQEHTSR